MSITFPQGGSGDSDVEVELEEPEFPLEELNRLDDMINKPRWVVPVLPKGELEVLLESSISLCKKGKTHVGSFLGQLCIDDVTCDM